MVELLSGADQAEGAFLNQVLEAQAPVHVLLGNRNHQAEVRLHHFFLGAPAEHQAPAELHQGHLDKGRPLLGIGIVTVVGFELVGQFFQLKQVSNFAGQLDLFIGPQQADAADLLEVNPDRVFGVDALRTDLDAGQGLSGLGCVLLGRLGIGGRSFTSGGQQLISGLIEIS